MTLRDALQLDRVSNDTGLTMSEAQDYMQEGAIAFDKKTGRYYIDASNFDEINEDFELWIFPIF